ncbi:MAG: hypothetical protein WC314_10805 [Vulcanimicrobiota bacterium]
MNRELTIDKDISWDRDRLELRLYLQEGFSAEQVVVHPERIQIQLKSGTEQHSTQISLPVRVDNHRATLSKQKGVYGETIDIKVHRCRIELQEVAV